MQAMSRLLLLMLVYGQHLAWSAAAAAIAIANQDPSCAVANSVTPPKFLDLLLPFVPVFTILPLLVHRLLYFLAKPYTPRRARLHRYDFIKTARRLGFSLKTSTSKHHFYPARRLRLLTQVPPPSPTPLHRPILTATLTLLLLSTTASATYLGNAAASNPAVAAVSRALHNLNMQHAAQAMTHQAPRLQIGPTTAVTIQTNPSPSTATTSPTHAAPSPSTATTSTTHAAPSPSTATTSTTHAAPSPPTTTTSTTHAAPSPPPSTTSTARANPSTSTTTACTSDPSPSPAIATNPLPTSSSSSQSTAPPPPPHPDAADCLTPFLPHGTVSPNPNNTLSKDPDHGWLFGNHPALTPYLRQRLRNSLLDRKQTSFAYSLSDMPGYHGIDGPFTIELNTTQPIFTKPRRYTPAEMTVTHAKCTELRDAGFITRAPSTCKYACRPTLPAKKSPDGLWTDHRFCIDYRPLNNATLPDRYGLHLPEDLYRQVGGATFFSKIDLRGAFHQVPIREEDQEKTAFWWDNQLYMYTRMPYGLVSGSAKCQRIMDLELAAAGLSNCALCFVDDLLVYSNSAEEHLEHITAVLDMLHSCGLRAHPDKCIFFADQVEFLGHNISPIGLSPHESKVAAIEALSSPANITELRSKLAFMNYYRCYVPEFSSIAAPLYALLKNDAPWQWGPAQESAFQRLKTIITTPGTVLRRFDQDRPVTLYTDWSNVGIAAVLAQQDDEQCEYMVACLSRSLNTHERNYSSYEGEMLAAVWGVKAFRQYLHGLHFRLVTDHQPLRWLMSTPDLTGKHMRWALILQEFDFTVEHRAGSAHANADTPSRYPLPTTFDPTGACLDPESPAATLAASPYPSPVEPSCCYTLLDHLPPPISPIPDTYCPTPHDLLSDPDPLAIEDCATDATAETAHVRGCAARWVAAAAEQLAAADRTQQPLQLDPVEPDAHGVRPTVRLSTEVVGPRFLAAAETDGVVLYEPFGGMCAGLDMVLTSGLRVKRYLYSDIDPAAQQVARSRVAQLHARYPLQFPHAASADAFSALPMDVREVHSDQLVAAGASLGDQWLVIAGWSCEDLSPAGKGKGLAGNRSSNFFDAVRIIGSLQQLQHARPPAYILENTAMQVPFAHPAVRERDFPLICSVVGAPVLLDAAQFGSYAHRLRNFWSNLAHPAQVALVAAQARRKAGLHVDDVLDPGHRTQLPVSVPGAPFYQCDQPGQPLSALPTLVAYPASRAFTRGGPGMLHVHDTGLLEEPNPDERERIMGYPTGCTQVGNVTELQRHAITGRAMDRFCVMHLMGIYCALADAHVAPSHPTCCSGLTAPFVCAPGSQDSLLCSPGARIMAKYGWVPGMPLLGPNAVSRTVEPIQLPGNDGTTGLGFSPLLGGGSSGSAADIEQVSENFKHLHVSCATHCCHATASASNSLCTEGELSEHFCALAKEAESAEAAEQAADPTADANLMFFLRNGQLPGGIEPGEASRIRRRARRYSLVEGQLQRTMKDGSKRTVPPPESRVDIIRTTHERTGHFGVKRTKHLLLASYWWAGLEADVVKVLNTCEVCARVKASFNAERPELQPLPIEGMFYRWGVDLAGPFTTSADGNEFVMICIEHFSKQIEVAAIPEKTAECTAQVFLSSVIARYGACAEVVTDQGKEFEGAFHKLLVDCLIDHRTTSANHPQADGLAERCVQTIKRALTKHVAQHKHLADWDLQLHWVALGYRASRQAATGLSPYQMLYGTQPIIPPAVKQRCEAPLLDFTDASAASQYILQRADLFKQHCAIAMQNIRIAQHRDTLRYRTVRSGCYLPSSVKFSVGDFVYVRRRTVVNSLQSEARPGIYRVLEVRPSGVLVLQGRCGGTMNVNVSECAPCHLSNINPALDPQLRRVGEDFPCSVCGTPDDEAVMVICDGCSKGYHTYCLQPPLAAVPEEEVWLCPECKAGGLTPTAVWIARQQNLPVGESDAALFPAAQQRQHDAAAELLQGKSVWVRGLGRGAAWMQARLEYVPRMQRLEHTRSPLKLVVDGLPAQYVSLRKATRLVEMGRPKGAVESVQPGASAGQAYATLAVAPASSSREVGNGVELSTEAGVEAAFARWCKVEASPALVKCCFEACERVMQRQGEPCQLPIDAKAVAAFLRIVDLRVCKRMVLAGGESEALATQLMQRHRQTLRCPDGAVREAAGQLDPSWYRLASKRGQIDWVFLCPPEGLRELALGIAVAQAGKGVAMFVHKPVMHQHSAEMGAMLQSFAQQGRLSFLYDKSSASTWVLVFASLQLKRIMLSVTGEVPDVGWVSVP